jgi:hypothetical protein
MDDQEGKQSNQASHLIRCLACGDVEPEVGFEPTTFRLRVVKHSSSLCLRVPSSQLTSLGASIQCGPDQGRYGRRNDQGNDQPAHVDYGVPAVRQGR